MAKKGSSDGSIREGTSTAKPLAHFRVLLIEDNEDDAALIRHALIACPGFIWDLAWVDRLEVGLASLAQQSYQVVLLDLSLPDSRGLDGLASLVTKFEDTPIVVVTGMEDEATALDALRKGAQDYVTKERIDSYTLAHTMRYAMERKREECALRRTTAELRALSSHVQQVREEERGRIARDLHDELGQRLIGLKIAIARLEQASNPNGLTYDDLAPRTQAMTGMVNETISAIRSLVRQLRPSVLDHLTLVESLAWLAHDFEQRTGIACRFLSDGITTAFTPQEASSVFRVVQEALTNVVRHAGATHVDIRLDQHEDMVDLVVQDNGRGITAAQARGRDSFGLMGIRERVLSLSGTLEVEGREGSGTCLHLKFPGRRGTGHG